jgi:hypothetical protein
MNRWMVIGLIVCACGSNSGGSPPGPGSISGTVGGQPLNVKDAVFNIDGNEVTVVVTDRENICALLSGTTLPGTTNVLFLSLANFVPPATLNPHATGDYAFFDLGGGAPPTSTGRYWYGGFETVDASCHAGIPSFATGGTVTVTQVGNTSTHLKASLTGLHFGTDTLNGNIEAAYCAAIASTSCGALVARPPQPAE